MKTTLQVEGAKGLTVLRGRIAQGGPFVLYHGAIATYSATWVGQYVDLLCFHLLTRPLPSASVQPFHKKENACSF